MPEWLWAASEQRGLMQGRTRGCWRWSPWETCVWAENSLCNSAVLCGFIESCVTHLLHLGSTLYKGNAALLKCRKNLGSVEGWGDPTCALWLWRRLTVRCHYGTSECLHHKSVTFRWKNVDSCPPWSTVLVMICTEAKASLSMPTVVISASYQLAHDFIMSKTQRPLKPTKRPYLALDHTFVHFS